MTSLFNAMQKNYTQATQADSAQWQAAFDAQRFFVVVQQTLIGQLSMGSTQFEQDGTTYDAPNLFPTLEAAQAELEDEKKEFLSRLKEDNAEALRSWIESGEDESDFEPDEEDSFDFDVMQVIWDGGDKITVLSECGEFVNDDQNTWQFHCGLN